MYVDDDNGNDNETNGNSNQENKTAADISVGEISTELSKVRDDFEVKLLRDDFLRGIHIYTRIYMYVYIH